MAADASPSQESSLIVVIANGLYLYGALFLVGLFVLGLRLDIVVCVFALASSGLSYLSQLFLAFHMQTASESSYHVHVGCMVGAITSAILAFCILIWGMTNVF